MLLHNAYYFEVTLHQILIVITLFSKDFSDMTWFLVTFSYILHRMRLRKLGGQLDYE